MHDAASATSAQVSFGRALFPAATGATHPAATVDPFSDGPKGRCRADSC
jgi:hypothetical protein